MHLQTAIELVVKYYICNIYGFESILTSKYKKLKKNNIQQYLNEIEKNNIKTLGFNELNSNFNTSCFRSIPGGINERSEFAKDSIDDWLTEIQFPVRSME